MTRVGFKFIIPLHSNEACVGAIWLAREKFHNASFGVSRVIKSNDLYICSVGVGGDIDKLVQYLYELEKSAEIPEIVSIAVTAAPMEAFSSGFLIIRSRDGSSALLTTDQFSEMVKQDKVEIHWKTHSDTNLLLQ